MASNTATYDFGPYIAQLRDLVDEHRVAPGGYSRIGPRFSSDQSPDAYGCADAANILYTLAEFPRGESERAAFIDQMNAFQSAATGEFSDGMHSTMHTTAHVLGALELFEAGPLHELTFLKPFHSRESLFGFMEDHVDWDHPWVGSHDGAGIAAAMSLAGEASAQWVDWYIEWLDRNVDEQTGFWRAGRINPLHAEIQYSRFANLAGSFHYHFNYHHFRRPFPHPDRVIDSCLEILEQDATALATTQVAFAEIDWIFCLNRSHRQSGYRTDDVRRALAEMARRVSSVLLDPATWEKAQFDDLHQAFGGLCAVTELQLALPGAIRTPQPLRLVLDRRPFI